MDNFDFKKYLAEGRIYQDLNEESDAKNTNVTEYVETSKDPVGDDLKKLAAFVKKGGSKAKDALKKFMDSIEVGSMQSAMATESLEEDARTDAEQEGYKDGFNDAKDDVKDALSKMKVSELKAKIKEDIISMLSEQEEEEDIEAEIEDEVEVDVEEPTLDASDAQEGLSADEKEIQDSLKIAYDNAVAIGDTKLSDQIGNSITFFTRTHVVER